MNRYEIIIYWSSEDDCFIAEVPELKSLMAHGDTQNEALSNAQDAVNLWLEVAKEDGMDIPEPKGRLIYA